jgi:carboxypeptidase C (cathepsin A)
MPTDDSKAPPAPAPATAAPPAPPVERSATSEHVLALPGGAGLPYTATCGTLLLHEDDVQDDKLHGRKPRASMFYVAYTAKDADAATRPVTFSFNGGPGSSSVWLHLGILGPWRVWTDEVGDPGAPPYRLEDNAHSLLADSDLVFIDPVGTGHSRMAHGEKPAEYHEYQRDLDAFAEFIRLWLARHGRFGSPKYLIGESYGTTRAAGLVKHLQDRHDIQLNGVMLVSLAIDFQTLHFDHGNELGHPLFLPTYAATAWYHKALAADLQTLPLAEVLRRAEAFANTDYVVALMAGARLAPDEHDRIAAQVARFSGLSVAYVKRCDLRPTPQRYFKELLRERGRTVGRLDTRFLGWDHDDAGEQPETDAAMSGLAGAYAAGIQRVLRERLQWAEDAPYVVLAHIWDKWKWKEFENRYVNVGDSLRGAMHANPHLRVYVASGLFDLGTPHAAGDWTLAHLGVRDVLRGNIRTSYFEAGHMMYIHGPSLERMAAELREFVRAR